MNHDRTLLTILAATTCIGLFPLDAPAADIQFDGLASQTFGSTSSWNPAQVPGALDTAIFDSPFGTTCFFDMSPTNKFAQVLESTTWFGLAASPLYMVEGDMWVADSPNFQIQQMDVTGDSTIHFGNGTLLASGGSTLTFDRVCLGTTFLLDGQGFAGSGTLTIAGAGSHLETTTLTEVGCFFHGELTIQSGATGQLAETRVPTGVGFLEGWPTGQLSALSGSSVSIESLRIAADVGGFVEGDVLASGAGTVVNILSQASSHVGAEEQDGFALVHFGDLLITDGALVRKHIGAGDTSRLYVNRTGTITLQTGGTLEALPGSEIVDRGLIHRDADGVLAIRTNGTLRVESSTAEGTPPGVLDIDGTFDFGTDLGATATVEMVGGGQAQVDLGWRFPQTPGASATTTVSGVGPSGPSSLLGGSPGDPAADLVVGDDGIGVLDVKDGGLVSFGDDLVVGREPTGDGHATITGINASGDRSNVTVSGPDADVFVGGDVGAAGGAQGELLVLDGAYVQTSGAMELARSAGSTALVTVDGRVGGIPGQPSEIIVGQNLLVGGTSITAGGDAELRVTEGAQLLVGGNALIWPTGELYVDGVQPGTVDVGADLDARGLIRLDGGLVSASGLVGNQGTVEGWGRIVAVDVYADSGVTAPRALDDIGPCESSCAAQSPAGCWCDDLCVGFGDCCQSVCAACPDLDFCPAGTLGVLEIMTAAYTQLPGALLDVELGPFGATIPQAYSQGPVDLQGDLAVAFMPGFVPLAGQEFIIVQGSARIGQFATAALPQGFELVYDADRVRLVPALCLADVDGDGAVGINDLLTLLASWGDTGPSAADIDGDGVVAIGDLLDLLAAWGSCP